jgi:hypothetical protein
MLEDGEFIKLAAQMYHRLYEELKKAGFSPDEAFEIVKSTARNTNFGTNKS